MLLSAAATRVVPASLEVSVGKIRCLRYQWDLQGSMGYCFADHCGVPGLSRFPWVACQHHGH